ncbi:MAG: hypothetical protein E7630_03765 [Ruminococcaceae bacterium]|nr:hypothetical protein [Oscillospiraceae bacterium]
MNRISKLTTIFILILATLTLCVSADDVYSSQDDPLVSLSYVNDVLGPEIMAQVLSKIETEYVKISDIGMASAGSYTYVTLKKGQTLMAKACCEVVLLEGTATTVVTSSANVAAGVGISDLTAGTVNVNGSLLPANHYMVIPKADGRGLVVSSDTAIILVRGEYNITG